MRTYSEFRPTGFDAKGAFLPDQQDWLVVPVSQTRDSGPFEESNFAVALKILGGESDTVEVHRFGHWGPGWFEIIIVHPDLRAAVEDIEASLENYPVLDDEDFSEREWNKASEYWVSLGTWRGGREERIRICDKYRVSIFAARRDGIPEAVEISYLAE